LAKRRHQIKVNELSSMLVYVLGHRPAEFGIVPSPEGFVSFKELVKALHEEPGWRYVRQSHINEVLLGRDRFLFEIEGDRIRTRERRWEMDLKGRFLDSVPAILFTPVRRRAHPVVMEKGVIPAPGKFLVLSSDEDTALRIGRRQDPKPVLLQVEAGKANKEGTLLYPFDTLYLCTEIPPKYIAGPPVARETPKTVAEKETKAAEQTRLADAFSAGTFPLDLARAPAPHRQEKGKKRKGWKESTRKMRRRKAE
jgi:putative RNA 2'-phosphotransferase